jgi:hypothetical protein
MELYRPVGLRELKLIADSGFKRFPPRLPEQPIFYPVLNFEYAAQIAGQWNTKRAPFAGFVTRFEIDDPYACRFEVRIVGAQDVHRELWVPAEQLSEFNDHILDNIRVVGTYYGEGFQEELDSLTSLPLCLTSGS